MPKWYIMCHAGAQTHKNILLLLCRGRLELISLHIVFWFLSSASVVMMFPLWVHRFPLWFDFTAKLRKNKNDWLFGWIGRSDRLSSVFVHKLGSLRRPTAINPLCLSLKSNDLIADFAWKILQRHGRRVFFYVSGSGAGFILLSPVQKKPHCQYVACPCRLKSVLVGQLRGLMSSQLYSKLVHLTT